MFLLCNVHDREYRTVYPDIRDVIFDISDSQLANRKNEAWDAIQPGSIVCVVRSSRRISTFFRVESKRKTSVKDAAGALQHVITGQVIGKLPQDQDMTTFLGSFNVQHPYLPGNKFSVGFNVADLGSTLDSVELNTESGARTVGDLSSE